jgi:hypothetical protein
MSRFAHQARMKTSLLELRSPILRRGFTLATGRKCPPKLLSMAPDGGSLPTVFEDTSRAAARSGWSHWGN